jgi:hypothetical protein
MKEKIPKNPHALKITQQARGRTGWVYDLSADEHRLTVSMFPRENADEPGEWRVEARASRSDEAIVVSEWGPTKADALQKVGAAWVARAEADNLPAFDFDAISKLLETVRGV